MGSIGAMALHSFGPFFALSQERVAMPEITLAAESGRQLGTGPSSRSRLEGRIPAVVYGHGVEATSISVDRRALRAVLHTDAGHNAVINLEIGDDRHLTIVKELQRHPVRNEVIHVDFLVVDRDQVVTVEVPLVIIGEAKALGQQGGTLEQLIYNLTMQAKPGDIPNEIEVDVTDIVIGGAIRVGDLSLPAGASTEVDPEEAVVIGQITRAGMEAERAEGEEGEGAEGGASDDGGSAAGESASEG
jgi:large subunit ribosomal protein L25